jgi:hypothetical protein
LKDKIVQNVCDRWDEFFKVLEIEKHKSTKDSQRACGWGMTNFEGSNRQHLAKNPWNEKTKA